MQVYPGFYLHGHIHTFIFNVELCSNGYCYYEANCTIPMPLAYLMRNYWDGLNMY